ncbi:conserved exported hypothetical protein [Verrucomicrobia bacterium]|nr:conserved exported hypothetical protein [Verrucomicrobiota bacterium]
MKKLGLVAALMLGGLLAGSNIATAQDTNQPPAPKKKGPTIERMLDRMTEELKLTDDQKTKVKAVLESSAEQMRGVPADQRREKRQEVRAEESKKFKEILTPEQFEKWQGMSQKRGKQAPPGDQKQSGTSSQ